MGSYSKFIRATRGANKAVINWSRFDRHRLAASGTLIAEVAGDERLQAEVRTLEDLARYYDDHKLWGQLDDECIREWKEVARCLERENPEDTPRIYFDTEDEMVFYFEFRAGDEPDIIVGRREYENDLANDTEAPVFPTDEELEANPDLEDEHCDRMEAQKVTFTNRLVDEAEAGADWNPQSLGHERLTMPVSYTSAFGFMSAYAALWSMT